MKGATEAGTESDKATPSGSSQLSREEQARLLDLSSDAIIVRTFEGNILYWNGGAEELYGWTRAEAEGQRTHSLLATKFPVSLAQVEKELLKNGTWIGELRYGNGWRFF